MPYFRLFVCSLYKKMLLISSFWNWLELILLLLLYIIT